MLKVEKIEILKEKESYIIPFGHNHNIVKILLVLSGESAEVTVSYAQNGITSELINLERHLWDGKRVLVFKPGLPIAASHIYIEINGDAELLDAEVYEIPDVDTSECYPAVKDVDLGKNYYLDTVTVFTPAHGYTQYTVYTSLNGRDFYELAKKTSHDSCDAEKGEIYSANGCEARFIRVFIEYCSEDIRAQVDKVEFSGRESGTPVLEYPEIDIKSFAESEYNREITANDTYDEVYGIIKRCIGEKYVSWFSLELEENPRNNDFDFFELSQVGDKIHIKANSGVSLATGINHYLKYFCKVSISQVGRQTKMPEVMPLIKVPVFRETPAKVRYAYNYCTLSYSMAFWGEEEWRRELDWLALSGVNLVLDLTAQEEVWRRFLGKIGYTHSEIKKYIAGPAYYAWAYMANLSGFGGPVHDSWFTKRTNLARKNQLIMRKLGMKPVLQGYSGMVPYDIKEKDADCDIIPQGMWCSFRRPDIIKTTSPAFIKYAGMFYEAQREVYGDISEYFATDPFHEGGITAGLSERVIAKEVLSAILRENADAVWVIQSWQGNPKSELLAGLEDVENGKCHALILDLYGEKTPHYKDGCENNNCYGYRDEFDHTPWVLCTINNFGGRLGMQAFIDSIAERVPYVLSNCKHNVGIGMAPEATFNTPVMYDFLFESIWYENGANPQKINLDEWIKDYAERRYGKKSISCEKAWEIFLNTAYKAEFNQLGQGAPESVVNSRPALVVNAASTWGNAIIGYDKDKLKVGAGLLLADYNELKDTDTYTYDVVTCLLQVLSNDAQDVLTAMAKAFLEKDVDMFSTKSAEFLEIADKMEKVASANEYYLLGKWVNSAKRLAYATDDFAGHLYKINAKALITTWGAYNQSEIGLLHDYSNRQWSGLIGDFYKKRWERWVDARKKELLGEVFEKEINWFSWEWEWVRSDREYDEIPAKIELNKLNIV